MHTSRILIPCRCLRLAVVLWAAAMGCLISSESLAQNSAAPGTGQPLTREGGAMSSPTNQAPTYLRDIQPILMGNCSRCHNQQSRFVYDWLDYQAAYADRWELRRRIWDSWKGNYYKETMPVANSPESLALTDQQRTMIRDWVDTGGQRGVPPPPGAPKSLAERIQSGQKLFVSICAACHQPTGRGLPNVFPPLAGSDFLNADKNRAIQTVLFGRQGEVVVNGSKYNNNMPSFPLNDQDVANVLTYVYSSFGNAGLEVKADEVAALRANPPAPSSTPAPKSQFE